MSILLWVDDIRDPNNQKWFNLSHSDGCVTVWVKSYNEFVSYINSHYPDIISFDHDLGECKSGYDCAKYLIEFALDHNCKLPICKCHSMNPVGRDNILSLISSYNKFISLGE